MQKRYNFWKMKYIKQLQKKVNEDEKEEVKQDNLENNIMNKSILKNVVFIYFSLLDIILKISYRYKKIYNILKYQ